MNDRPTLVLLLDVISMSRVSQRLNRMQRKAYPEEDKTRYLFLEQFQISKRVRFLLMLPFWLTAVALLVPLFLPYMTAFTLVAYTIALYVSPLLGLFGLPILFILAIRLAEVTDKELRGHHIIGPYYSYTVNGVTLGCYIFLSVFLLREMEMTWFGYPALFPWAGDMAFATIGALLGIGAITLRQHYWDDPEKRDDLLDKTLFGTAKWADRSELGDVDTGLLPTLDSLEVPFHIPDNGLLVGLLDKEVLRFDREGHVLTVAPTGTGKGVSAVIPNLLNYPGSTVVIDPKGENYAITAKYRREVLKQRIMLLDPFQVCRSNASDSEGRIIYPDNFREEDLGGINPFSLFPIVAHGSAYDVASTIADMMVVRDPEEKEPHWADKARSALRTVISATIYSDSPVNELNLATVRETLCLSQAGWEDFIKVHQEAEMVHPALRRGINELERMGTEEKANVLSGALRHSEFLESDPVRESLAYTHIGGEEFDLRDVKADGNISIYIVLPPSMLKLYNRLLRLWIATILQAVVAVKGQPRYRTLFLLDEMAQLGRMQPVEEAVSLMRGYGITLWMVIQDLSQLQQLYPQNWRTFLSNAGIQQFFGVQDHETAKYVSELSGQSTRQFTSYSNQRGANEGSNYSESEGKSGSSGSKSVIGSSSSSDSKSFGVSQGSSQSQTINETVTGRPLIFPDEVRCLNRNEQLLFVEQHNPIKSRKLVYYRHKELAARAAESPYRRPLNTAPSKGASPS